MRPGLTPVRRAVGVAAVAFLLSAAVVFYREAPGSPTSAGSSPSTIAGVSASPAPTRLSTQSATPSGQSSSVAPSRAPDPPSPTSTTRPDAGENAGSGSAEAAISVERPASPATPFQTVRIEGTCRAGPDTFVEVQRWERHRWLAFPLRAKTDQSGRFTAYVEFGRPGLYWLRVQDPDSGTKSKPFLLMIKD